MTRAVCTTLLIVSCLPLRIQAIQTPPVRDSAGVTIMSFAEPRLPLGSWRFQVEPDLTLGTLDVPPEEVLYGIQRGTILSNGTIVVGLALGNSIELRYFESDGSFLTSAARYGRGPGEFVDLAGLFPVQGDSVLAFGSVGMRYAVFDRMGNRGRSGGFPLPVAFPAGLVDEEHIVLQDVVTGVPSARTGPRQSQLLILNFDLVDEEIDTVAWSPYQKWFRDEEAFVFQQPYTVLTRVAVSDDRVWIARTDVPEVRGYAPNGELRVIVRGPWSTRPMTGRDRRNWERSYAVDLEHRHRFINEHAEYPEELPAIDNILTDRSGNLWVLRFTPVGSDADLTWDVFDPEGRWLTTLEMPLEIFGGCARRGYLPRCNRILEIGTDYVLMKDIDELDIGRVRRHSLSR